ncbi:MAG: NYN domain-containing protein [Anaerolineaceae bacterium]|nr:NYN domain-containing protein [Anaerolineaceae bacterium]
MEYYIDGHNLIPKISGIRLSDENDEPELLERIQEYARLSRKKCTVFFDKAPENKTKDSSFGTVHVIYVTHHMKADEEIIDRVNKLGKTRAKEITVVSSDHHVEWQCRQAGALTMTSENFAAQMNRMFSSGTGNSGKGRKTQRIEPKLSAKEVDEWLEIFSQKR